jgi:hypothetical protein
MFEYFFGDLPVQFDKVRIEIASNETGCRARTGKVIRSVVSGTVATLLSLIFSSGIPEQEKPHFLLSAPRKKIGILLSWPFCKSHGETVLER